MNKISMPNCPGNGFRNSKYLNLLPANYLSFKNKSFLVLGI